MTGISVVHDGQVVSNPYLTRITIRNSGSTDVTSANFDRGRPLKLETSVPLISVLEPTLEPEGLPSVAQSASGNEIAIGPDLIVQGCTINFVILTDGRPDIEIESYISNTIMRVYTGDSTPEPEPFHKKILSLFGALAAMVAITVLVTILMVGLISWLMPDSVDRSIVVTPVNINGKTVTFASGAHWDKAQKIAMRFQCGSLTRSLDVMVGGDGSFQISLENVKLPRQVNCKLYTKNKWFFVGDSYWGSFVLK
ncbi:hypothetical protein GCM10010411_13560 [Actinomadura fulvescens]|uniref:Uncharacterized protein n=2 Tax=Actinomadura fulvescens TaxID=46160 RepID=A0ABN3PHF4_9ACTN